MKQEQKTTQDNKVKQLLAAVPKEWPGAFGLFKYSRAAVGFNLWTVILLYVFMIIVAAVFEGVFQVSADNSSPIIKLGYNLALSVTSIAFAAAMLAGVNRQKISFTESFTRLKLKTYVNAILNSMLVTLILILSLLALIVPFFFVVPRLMLCQYYIIEQNMGPIEAFTASWNASKGHVGKVYGIYGVTLLFILVVITIIGIPVAIYLFAAYSAAFALLYKYLIENSETEGTDEKE